MIFSIKGISMLHIYRQLHTHDPCRGRLVIKNEEDFETMYPAQASPGRLVPDVGHLPPSLALPSP